MHRVMFAAIATLLVAVPTIHAQTTVPVNSRVRVTMRNGEGVTGRLAEVRGDTLIVIDEGLLFSSQYRIPAASTRRVDVSRGKAVSPVRVIGGALLGAAAGTLVVGVVPGLSKMECSADVCGAGPAFTEGLLVGTLGGVLLGVLTPADRWEAVPSPVRIGFGGDGRQARLAVSLAF